MTDSNDVLRICSVLRDTFSPNSEIRNAAELSFKTIETSPGLLSYLLRIIEEAQIEVDVRLAAAIYLKNQIRRRWSTTQSYRIGRDSENEENNNAHKQTVFNEEDKVLVRNRIFEVFVAVCSITTARNTIEDCLRYLCIYDYPDKLENLLSNTLKILSSYKSELESSIFCALSAIKCIVMKYEVDMSDDRKHLREVMTLALPHLLNIAESLIHKDWINYVPGALMLKVICRIYWSCSHIMLTKCTFLFSSFQQWMDLYRSILTHPLDPTHIGVEDVGRLEAAKTKKRAAQIVHRFLSRYSSSNEELQDLYIKFVDQSAFMFTDAFISILNECKKDPRYDFGERVRCLMLLYLTQSLEISKSYIYIKPQCEYIVREFCIPALCYTDTDIENWDTDPIDYLRSQMDDDDFDAHCSYRAAAKGFIRTLTKYRGNEFVPKILSMADTLLVGTSNDKDGDKEKYIGLSLIGTIANRLINPRRSIPISGFSNTYLLPSLSSENKMIKYIACLTFKNFVYTSKGAFCKNLSQTTFDEQFLEQSLRKVLFLCKDSELPIRVAAVTTLRAYFEISLKLPSPILKSVVLSELTYIVSSLFSLVSEVDNENIYISLQTLVEYYGEEVMPHTVQIVQLLSSTMDRLLSDSCPLQDEESSERNMTSTIYVAETLSIILSSCNYMALRMASQPIQDILIPIIKKMMTPINVEFLDDALKWLSLITCHSQVISDDVLHIFELLHGSYCGGDWMMNLGFSDEERNGWSADYFDMMTPIIHNLIIRDLNRFANTLSSNNGKTYLDLFFEIINKAFKFNSSSRYTLLIHLFEALMYIPPYPTPHPPSIPDDCIKMAIVDIVLKKNRDSKLLEDQIKCLAYMAIYDVHKLIQILNNWDITDRFIWRFSKSSKVKSFSGRKAYIVAVSLFVSAYKLSPSLFPLPFVNQMPVIIKGMAKLVEAVIPTRLAKNKDKSEGSASFESGDDSEVALEDIDDAVQRVKIIDTEQESLDSDDDDEEYDDDEDEEYEEVEMESNSAFYPKPFDKVNEIEIIRNSLEEHNDVYIYSIGLAKVNQLNKLIYSNPSILEQDKTGT